MNFGDGWIEKVLLIIMFLLISLSMSREEPLINHVIIWLKRVVKGDRKWKD